MRRKALITIPIYEALDKLIRQKKNGTKKRFTAKDALGELRVLYKARLKII